MRVVYLNIRMCVSISSTLFGCQIHFMILQFASSFICIYVLGRLAYVCVPTLFRSSLVAQKWRHSINNFWFTRKKTSIWMDCCLSAKVRALTVCHQHGYRFLYIRFIRFVRSTWAHRHTHKHTHSKNKCWQTANRENDVISFNYVLKGAFIRGEKVNTETNEMLRNENNYRLWQTVLYAMQ